MKRRGLFALFVISICGCQSRPTNPVVSIANRLTGTRCYVRKVPPGSKWIDYDNGGGWVQLGEDGKVRPIPPPDQETPSSANPNNLNQ